MGTAEHTLRTEFNARFLSLEGEVSRLSTIVKTLSEKLQKMAALSSHLHSGNSISRPTRPPTTAPRPPTRPRTSAPRPPPSLPPPSQRTAPARAPNHLPFRIVWGTQRSCSTQVIHKAICALLPSSLLTSITVKRSFRQRAARPMWWYTVISPADVVDQITSIWHILESKTNWSLLQSLSERLPRPAQHPANGSTHPLTPPPSSSPNQATTPSVSVTNPPPTASLGELPPPPSNLPDTSCDHLYSPLSPTEKSTSPLDPHNSAFF